MGITLRRPIVAPQANGEREMHFVGREILARSVTSAAVVAAMALTVGAAQAQGKPPIVMKISLAALNDPLHQFAKDYAALLEKDADGRIKPEIFPESQPGTTR